MFGDAREFKHQIERGHGARSSSAEDPIPFIGVSNKTVSQQIRRHRKLDRHAHGLPRGDTAGKEMLSTVPQDIVVDGSIYQLGQEVVQDYRLLMFADSFPSFPIGISGSGWNGILHLVVELQKGDMSLGDGEILIVSRITNTGTPIVCTTGRFAWKVNRKCVGDSMDWPAG
ncbi:MAG: hypothetical protein KDA66_02340 [Planctomycetaceae bacterium]|nr:hypothetical protein [Planctomycetaceae bacterium]